MEYAWKVVSDSGFGMFRKLTSLLAGGDCALDYSRFMSKVFPDIPGSLIFTFSDRQIAEDWARKGLESRAIQFGVVDGYYTLASTFMLDFKTVQYGDKDSVLLFWATVAQAGDTDRLLCSLLSDTHLTIDDVPDFTVFSHWFIPLCFNSGFADDLQFVFGGSQRDFLQLINQQFDLNCQDLDCVVTQIPADVLYNKLFKE